MGAFCLGGEEPHKGEFGAGLRISELCGLRWRDLAERDDAAQATVFGKGGKTRLVLLSANTWRQIRELRDEAGPTIRCCGRARAAPSTPAKSIGS